VHCMTVEKMGIPTAPVITSRFEDLVKTVAYKAGMPKERFTFVPHPVGGKTAATLREYVLGKDPVTGRPVLESILEALSRPLSEDEKKTGSIERSVSRLVKPDTEENLHRFFLESGWTDGLPIVLPTEARVAEMLKKTGHRPDEVIGKMRPTETQEYWNYTVEKVAVNAVMAGARPEYFPVILALAAAQETALHSSTSSFAAMVVVNGPIRKELGMNAEIGALGPWNRAHATIGRA